MNLECIACGCTDVLPCAGGCFWTWQYPEGDKLERFGLCSCCAAIPFDALVEKIRVRQETIIYAAHMSIARGAHA